MKVVIIKAQNLADVIKRAVNICLKLEEKELYFLSTPDQINNMRDILNKSEVVKEIQVSNKTIYIAKGIKIQLENIDYYE